MSDLLINLSMVIPQPTGISAYALNLLPHLRSLDPTLLSAQAIPGFSHYSIPANLTPDQGKKGHLSRLLWTQWQLPKMYRTLAARLLFSPIPEAPLLSPCQSVVMVHDCIPLRFPQRGSPLTPYHRYYIPQVVQQAAHVICNSMSTAQDVMRFCQIPAHKITPIMLAYDSERYRFLDLPTQNYFLYLGRLDPHKNVQRLVSAFAAVVKGTAFKNTKEKECELWLAGPPDARYLPGVLDQAEALGVRDRLKILGYVDPDTLPVLINQAIALVFPSLWEGFGLPVLEAMACGTPVITSSVSSLPEVAGDAALLVDPIDEGAIASAMAALLNDATLGAQLRQAGLQRAQQFSWATTGAATTAVLQRFL
jgi:glycosyltransferase involved in cell wall biosynthesis